MAGALDYDSIIPLYTQVVDILRQNIQEGVFDNKKKLPAEEELIAQYNVSRITIRKAISILVDEGVLEKKQGKGTFLVHPPLKKSFQTPCISFTQTCVANGARAGAKVIKVALDVPHNSQISSWLGLRPGDKAVRILRVRNLDEVPCVIEDNFFPVSYAYLLDINWEDRSIYDYLLNENKVSVLPGSLIMRIMRADEQAVKYLHVKKNTPLLHMTGFTRCADDSILHTCEQIGYNEDFEFILR